MNCLFNISGIPTVTHPTPLYIALGTECPGPTNRFLTDDPALATGFSNPRDAEEAVEELRGNRDADPMLRACHLEDRERLWHVTSRVPGSRS